MRRVSQVMRQCHRAIEDINLYQILQSEIQHELSSPTFQNGQSGFLGDYVVDWDSSRSQDVVLRRKSELGEEVAISALLGHETFAEEGMYPRGVCMKVCVKKPGLNSILQFDCGVFEKGINGSYFDIYSAHYLPSTACLKPSSYLGPSFGDLDPALQDALKEYLVAMGISESLTNFLLQHLHKKEQEQYVNWLQKLESLVARGE